MQKHPLRCKPQKESTMQTITEVVDSSQEVLLQALRKQAPRRGISTVGASSPPPIARIRDVRGITLSAKCAMLLLHSREPNIFPSMQLLAADMGVSAPTAKRAVRELKRAGYLRAIPRIGQTNLYSLTVAGDPPPRSPMTPPQVTHDPPPRSPMTPEVSKEVFKISNKRERESKRSLSPGNQSLKETTTCPACERSWTVASGSICFNCNMEVSTIKRNIEERKSRDEAYKAEQQKRADAQIKELEFNRQKREAQRKEAETRTQEQKAKQPKEYSVEAEARHQGNRKKLFDLTPGKPYDAGILEYYHQGGERRAVARAC